MRQRFKAEIFSEPDGKPSLGRVLTVVIVAFVLGWDTSNMIITWHFNFLHPDRVMNVFPDAITLGAQGVFMTLFYGVNKFAGTYAAKPVVPAASPVSAAGSASS